MQGVLSNLLTFLAAIAALVKSSDTNEQNEEDSNASFEGVLVVVQMAVLYLALGLWVLSFLMHLFEYGRKKTSALVVSPAVAVGGRVMGLLLEVCLSCGRRRHIEADEPTSPSCSSLSSSEGDDEKERELHRSKKNQSQDELLVTSPLTPFESDKSGRAATQADSVKYLNDKADNGVIFLQRRHLAVVPVEERQRRLQKLVHSICQQQQCQRRNI